MRIALMLEGQEGIDWSQWLLLAKAAEAAGLDGLFRSDHYRSIHRGDPAGSLDAWAVLAALAACTERIRLGTLVSPVTFRHPSVLAKSVVTVDHISNGRVELGVGTGWYQPEHDAYHFPFMTLGQRFAEFERQLAEIDRQWSDDSIWPKPVQRPRPPIIIGGSAKPRTVAAAVRFADEYNTIAESLDQVAERRRTLDEAARGAGRAPLTFSIMVSAALGRDEAEAQDRRRQQIEATRMPITPLLVGTVEMVAEELRRFEAVGVERAIIPNLVHEDLEVVTLLGELARAIPEVSE